jgi:hypothetical protein
MPAKKDRNMKKEPWNSSDDFARTLQLADFGFPDQVRIMANMDIQPKTYSQAREILSSLVDHPMVSRSGLYATISRKSIEKILSGPSVEDSHNYKAHILAAGNIDRLYTNAIEPWNFEMNPDKNNDGLVSVRRLFAPMEYENQIVVVKITVKEMKNINDGNRIYTIKTLDVFLDV